jgi:hypothetical protein
VQSGSYQVDGDGNLVFFGYGTSMITAADHFTYIVGRAPRLDAPGRTTQAVADQAVVSPTSKGGVANRFLFDLHYLELLRSPLYPDGFATDAGRR